VQASGSCKTIQKTNDDEAATQREVALAFGIGTIVGEAERTAHARDWVAEDLALK
jgi:hypothetical protein